MAGSVFFMLAYRQAPGYKRLAGTPALSFREYYERRLKKKGPARGEAAFLFGGKKDPYALLYISDACSDGENEFLRKLSRSRRQNAYRPGLPGREKGYRAFLREAERAFLMTRKLNGKIALLARGAGSPVAVYLAAVYPEATAALILIEPAFSGERTGEIARFFEEAARRRAGEDRNSLFLRSLSELALGRGRPGGIRAPVLMLYRYENERRGDFTSDPSRALEVFAGFGRRVGPHPLNYAWATPLATGEKRLLESVSSFLEDLGSPRRF